LRALPFGAIFPAMKLTELLKQRADLVPLNIGQQEIAAAMDPPSHQPQVSRWERGEVMKPTDEWITRWTRVLNKLRRKGVKRISEEEVRRAHARTVGIPYRKSKPDPSRLARVA
jgi:hypothetical protein